MREGQVRAPRPCCGFRNCTAELSLETGHTHCVTSQCFSPTPHGTPLLSVLEQYCSFPVSQHQWLFQDSWQDHTPPHPLPRPAAAPRSSGLTSQGSRPLEPHEEACADLELFCPDHRAKPLQQPGRVATGQDRGPGAHLLPAGCSELAIRNQGPCDQIFSWCHRHQNCKDF